MRRGGVLRLLAGLPLALVMSAATLTVRVPGERWRYHDRAGGGQPPSQERLAGIDAPERDQPFRQRRRQGLAELAFKSVGETVRRGGVCGALWGEAHLGEMTSRDKALVAFTLCGLRRRAAQGLVGLCECVSTRVGSVAKRQSQPLRAYSAGGSHPCAPDSAHLSVGPFSGSIG